MHADNLSLFVFLHLQTFSSLRHFLVSIIWSLKDDKSQTRYFFFFYINFSFFQFLFFLRKLKRRKNKSMLQKCEHKFDGAPLKHVKLFTDFPFDRFISFHLDIFLNLRNANYEYEELIMLMRVGVIQLSNSFRIKACTQEWDSYLGNFYYSHSTFLQYTFIYVLPRI